MKHRKLFPVDNSTQTADCMFCEPACNPDKCIPNVVIVFPPPPPPPPPPPLHHQVSPYVIIFVCVIAFFFLFILFNVIRAKARAVNQANNNRPQQALSDGSEEELVSENRIDHPIWFITTVGLQPSTINSISENETLRLLPKCNHAFHIYCIDTWLKSHTNCPMCRASIVSTSVNSAPLPVIDQNSVSSNVIANSQIDNSEIDRQLGENQERNVQDGENRTRTEEGSERILKHSINSNETDVLQVLEHDSQPLKRSVSLAETTMTLEFDDFGPLDESGDFSADQINDATKKQDVKNQARLERQVVVLQLCSVCIKAPSP
ncbi:hypothetical protein LWI28_010255 [Acer negundo]|uniref:RING-type E3 ubiquitin transferase n=1 Tax=Acer negundo TaxID=4023 RepID=A0AAD5P5L8_ACENE|nr:hypothetical protein LWI28_010255 [Acer negundo]